MQNMIEFPMAFLAGLLSFLSPCVLPLLPSYMAILAGNAFEDAFSSAKSTVLQGSAAFSMGFTIVFVLLGIIFSQAGMMLGGGIAVFTVIAGIVIVLLGINTIFDIASFLNIEKRLRLKRKPSGFISCMLFGAAFGAGWSPCVGPMLASILLMAGTGSMSRAAVLLVLYSLGLALPFSSAAFFFGRLQKIFIPIKKHLGKIKIVSGIVLIIVGVYMILGKIRTVSGTFAAFGLSLERFPRNNPFLSDAVFSLFYTVIFVVFAFARIRKRKKLKAEGQEVRKSTGIGFFITGFIFGILAILEAANLISTPEIIASWLSFEGI